MQPITKLAFSPDGRFIAENSASVIGSHCATTLYNARNGHHMGMETGAHSPRYRGGVAFSPDSRLLAFSDGYPGQGIHIVATPASDLRNLFRGLVLPAFEVVFTLPSKVARELAFSPDGRLLASTDEEGYDYVVKLWDVTSRQLRHVLSLHREINGIAFSPDGRLIAAAADDPVVRLWDPATGELVHEVDSQAEEVNAVAFSPGGRFLTVAADEVQLWPLPR